MVRRIQSTAGIRQGNYDVAPVVAPQYYTVHSSIRRVAVSGPSPVRLCRQWTMQRPALTRTTKYLSLATSNCSRPDRRLLADRNTHTHILTTYLIHVVYPLLIIISRNQLYLIKSVFKKHGSIWCIAIEMHDWDKKSAIYFNST